MQFPALPSPRPPHAVAASVAVKRVERLAVESQPGQGVASDLPRSSHSTAARVSVFTIFACRRHRLLRFASETNQIDTMITGTVVRQELQCRIASRLR